MPSLLNLIPNAVSQSPAQIIYTEIVSPAPASFTDTLYVVMPDWSVKFPFAITEWPAAHGNTLPLVGDSALLVTDSRGLLRCVWWDGLMTYATQTSLNYYLTPTASGVASHNLITAAPYPSKTPTSYTNVNDLQTLQNYITYPLVPNQGFLAAGQFEFHIHGLQKSGNQIVRLFAEIWETDSIGNHLAMIGQTQGSHPLTSDEIEYRLFFINQNVYNFSSINSRLACHVKALVGGIGGAGITLFVGGTADSHVIIPTTINAPLTPSAWIVPTPINSWVNVAATVGLAYFKDPFGFVHLRGRISGGANGSIAFNLPVGFRPGGNDDYAAAGFNGSVPTAAFANILSNGNIGVWYSAGTVDIGLGGINFLAEN